ncbi:MAG: hypothetical protein D6706_10075, partial [Chloroflexi bacterium]
EDIVISIIDPNGATILEQNNAPAGEVERIEGLPLTIIGQYQIHVRTANGSMTDYAIMYLDDSAYTFVFMGILTYGETRSNITLPEENDHFWHFYGTAGENITINITPGADGDVFLELYAPSTDKISGFVDDGLMGEAEQYSTTLPETGIYSIRTGEFDFAATTYTITLLRN